MKLIEIDHAVSIIVIPFIMMVASNGPWNIKLDANKENVLNKFNTNTLKQSHDASVVDFP